MALSTNKVQSLIADLDNDAKLKQEYENNPAETLKRHASEDPKNDVWIYRIVVAALSLVVLIIACGILVNVAAIQAADKVITIIASLGSAAIGALAGLLAPSPVKQGD